MEVRDRFYTFILNCHLQFFVLYFFVVKVHSSKREERVDDDWCSRSLKSIPSVKALSRINFENCKKQQHQHRMGTISFVRVRNEMREMNENKEDPSQVDVFVATRTRLKGKELDLGT
ncbi:hypothetical protein AHAS_Ahas05G0279900 [Arachis hypogaea]